MRNLQVVMAERLRSLRNEHRQEALSSGRQWATGGIESGGIVTRGQISGDSGRYPSPGCGASPLHVPRAFHGMSTGLGRDGTLVPATGSNAQGQIQLDVDELVHGRASSAALSEMRLSLVAGSHCEANRGSTISHQKLPNSGTPHSSCGSPTQSSALASPIKARQPGKST